MISLVKVDEAGVFHDDAHYEHAYESGQGGDLQHEPAPEVGDDGQDGKGEQLPARRRRVAHHDPYRHPY